jgi:hypothetical protein
MKKTLTLILILASLALSAQTYRFDTVAVKSVDEPFKLIALDGNIEFFYRESKRYVKTTFDADTTSFTLRIDSLKSRKKSEEPGAYILFFDGFYMEGELTGAHYIISTRFEGTRFESIGFNDGFIIYVFLIKENLPTIQGKANAKKTNDKRSSLLVQQ